jgi:hypothetical protein
MNETTETVTQRPSRGIVATMSKTFGIVIAASALVAGGATVASATGQFGASGSHCHTVSTKMVTQTRDVSGQTAGSTRYGPTVQHVRTVTRYVFSGTETRQTTTTVSRCTGKLGTTVTSTPWSTAKIVTIVTTQRV